MIGNTKFDILLFFLQMIPSVKYLGISPTWPVVHLKGWSEVNDVLYQFVHLVVLRWHNSHDCLADMYHVLLLLLWLLLSVL